MDNLKLILIIAVGVIIGLIISYILKIPFAVALIDAFKTKVLSINIAGISLGDFVSVSSIVGIAGLGYQLYTSHKDKIAAQAENAKQQLANKELYEGYSNVNTQLTEANQIKDQALQTLDSKTKEFKESANKIAGLEEQVKNLRQTIHTYDTETIPNLQRKVIERTTIR